MKKNWSILKYFSTLNSKYSCFDIAKKAYWGRLSHSEARWYWPTDVLKLILVNKQNVFFFAWDLINISCRQSRQYAIKKRDKLQLFSKDIYVLLGIKSFKYK